MLGWTHSKIIHQRMQINNLGSNRALFLFSNYLENDIRSVQLNNGNDEYEEIIICVVRPDGGVHPLCLHEDDVETDLFVDPNRTNMEDVNDSDVIKNYGEGWYGQRPVPSLGGEFIFTGN